MRTEKKIGAMMRAQAISAVAVGDTIVTTSYLGVEFYEVVAIGPKTVTGKRRYLRDDGTFYYSGYPERIPREAVIMMNEQTKPVLDRIVRAQAELEAATRDSYRFRMGGLSA